MTYTAKLTYTTLIDSILLEANDSRVNQINKETILKRWVNEAQAKICDLIPVYDMVGIRYIGLQEDYYFGDTTGIGSGQLTSLGTAVTGINTTFLETVKQGSILTVGTQSAIVDSVTDDTDLVLVAAFGTDITSASNYTYIGAASEIPTEVIEIQFSDRLEGCFLRRVLNKNMEWLLDLRRRDGVKPYTNFDRPYVSAIQNKNGVKSMKVYPTAEIDKTATLYGRIKVMPRLHSSDTLGSLLD